MSRIGTLVLCGTLAGLAHMLTWQWFAQTVTPPDLPGRLASLSYAVPSLTSPSGVTARLDVRVIDRDLARLAEVTRSIRTYSASQGMAVVPALAAKHGLGVTLGAWIGRDPGRNHKEIRAALRAAVSHANVRGIVIGNEALLRQDINVDGLIALLRYARLQTRLPVTTAEPWHVWLQYPGLTAEVDYIAAHVLPYWEGLTAAQAVPHVLETYRRLQAAFPDKRIVIAEFGWPSNGRDRGDATPGRLQQASVVRNFVAELQRRGIDYNLLEAFDQPWKTAEGRVGAYWGLFEAEGRRKFPLTGTVHTERRHAMALALLLGTLLTALLILGQRCTRKQALALSLAAHAAGAGTVWAFFYPSTAYLPLGEIVTWVLGLILLMPLLATALVRINEIAHDLFGHAPRRLVRRTPSPDPGASWPKVSIHVPACREPPALVKACLDSLARLDYPDFEVVVVVNNTREATLWRPVRAHCRALGARFRFLHFPRIEGFKAGALAAARRAADRDAEIIAVLDADYHVRPSWLRHLVPLFRDSTVAFVQAPQDHSEAGASPVQWMMNCEYAGFFDIGMVQRNEANAAIVHGTMLLLRKSALDRAGGWATDTIVEDTELGLRLLAHGFQGHYTDRRYGHGVLPDDAAAYHNQRRRWAHGAMQILRKHWRLLLPGRRRLTAAQKWHFAAGWMGWLSDTAAVGLAVFNLAAAPFMLAGLVAFPPACLIVPALAAFGVGALHTGLLYRRRVTRSPGRILAAALAAMSLQLTVARAVLGGLLNRPLPFQRTDKGGGNEAARRGKTAVPEAAAGMLLGTAAAVLGSANPHQVLEQYLFAVLLAVQALPFLATAAMAIGERVASSRRRTIGSRWRSPTARQRMPEGRI